MVLLKQFLGAFLRREADYLPMACWATCTCNETVLRNGMVMYMVLYCFLHNPLMRLAPPRRSSFLPLHSLLC